ncbi:MAG TPA: dihydroneopterin aldolase [Opitutaceae bacterium]|nr:dihydroneopterin aldolase [Opitutaceae bacterium]
MDKLILRELHFIARHGVLPIEMENSQHFSATLELELPLMAAGKSDRLDQTVDYCAVQNVVRSIIEGSHKKLIETLAESVAAELLRAFPLLMAVTVEILKPRPPVDFQFAGVSVRIRRERNPKPAV